MLTTKSKVNPFLLAAVFFGAAVGCAAQSGQLAAAAPRQQKTVPPENQWRRQAVDLATQADTVPPAIRKVRDAYWDKRFPLPEGPGTLHFSNGSSVVHGDGSPQGEFPGLHYYLWIIGRFESFHVFQTSGRGGLYTEMNVRVQHVFKNQPQTSLAEGQLIDIAIAGGVAIGGQGNTIAFLSADYLPLIQPGHTYLMEVIPCQKFMECSGGDFFWPGRKWDLTSGTVQPVEAYDIRFAATGRSQIAGTPASAIIPQFEQILAQFKKEDGTR